MLALVSGALMPALAGLAGLALDLGALLALLVVQLVPWAIGAWLRPARPALARPLQRFGTALLVALVVALILGPAHASISLVHNLTLVLLVAAAARTAAATSLAILVFGIAMFVIAIGP